VAAAVAAALAAAVAAVAKVAKVDDEDDVQRCWRGGHSMAAVSFNGNGSGGYR